MPLEGSNLNDDVWGLDRHHYDHFSLRHSWQHGQASEYQSVYTQAKLSRSNSITASKTSRFCKILRKVSALITIAPGIIDQIASTSTFLLIFLEQLILQLIGQADVLFIGFILIVMGISLATSLQKISQTGYRIQRKGADVRHSGSYPVLRSASRFQELRLCHEVRLWRVSRMASQCCPDHHAISKCLAK